MVANEVLRLFRKPEQLAVAVRIYELADLRRWGPFRCSDGYLMESGASKRTVRTVIDVLREEGLLTIVSPGDRQNPRRIQIVCPAPQKPPPVADHVPDHEVNHEVNHEAGHGNNGETLPLGESGPRPEPHSGPHSGPHAGLKIQTHKADVQKQTPDSVEQVSPQADDSHAHFGEVRDGWARVRKAWGKRKTSYTLSRPKGAPKGAGEALYCLTLRKKPAEVREVMDYLSAGNDPRPGGSEYYKANCGPLQVWRHFGALLDLARDPVEADRPHDPSDYEANKRKYGFDKEKNDANFQRAKRERDERRAQELRRNEERQQLGREG